MKNNQLTVRSTILPQKNAFCKRVSELMDLIEQADIVLVHILIKMIR